MQFLAEAPNIELNDLRPKWLDEIETGPVGESTDRKLAAAILRNTLSKEEAWMQPPYRLFDRQMKRFWVFGELHWDSPTPLLCWDSQTASLAVLRWVEGWPQSISSSPVAVEQKALHRLKTKSVDASPATVFGILEQSNDWHVVAFEPLGSIASYWGASRVLDSGRLSEHQRTVQATLDEHRRHIRFTNQARWWLVCSFATEIKKIHRAGVAHGSISSLTTLIRDGSEQQGILLQSSVLIYCPGLEKPNHTWYADIRAYWCWRNGEARSDRQSSPVFVPANTLRLLLCDYSQATVDYKRSGVEFFSKARADVLNLVMLARESLLCAPFSVDDRLERDLQVIEDRAKSVTNNDNGLDILDVCLEEISSLHDRRIRLSGGRMAWLGATSSLPNVGLVCFALLCAYIVYQLLFPFVGSAPVVVVMGSDSPGGDTGFAILSREIYRCYELGSTGRCADPRPSRVELLGWEVKDNAEATLGNASVWRYWTSGPWTLLSRLVLHNRRAVVVGMIEQDEFAPDDMTPLATWDEYLHVLYFPDSAVEERVVDWNDLDPGTICNDPERLDLADAEDQKLCKDELGNTQRDITQWLAARRLKDEPYPRLLAFRTAAPHEQTLALLEEGSAQLVDIGTLDHPTAEMVYPDGAKMLKSRALLVVASDQMGSEVQKNGLLFICAALKRATEDRAGLRFDVRIESDWGCDDQ